MGLPRWYFWVGTSASLLCLSALLIFPWGEMSYRRGILVGAAWASFFVLAPFALYDRLRFWWATRTLTALIFVAFASPFVYACFVPWEASPFRAESGAGLARLLWGLGICGMPALWYTLFGEEDDRDF